MNNKKILILNGSPRKKGTSYSFARTLKILAEGEGNTVEIIHIIEYLEEGESFKDLSSMLSEINIIGLVSPLYVDSLPYPVIWFFEKLANEYKNELSNKYFFAIGQCAFPYAKLIEPLLGSCKCFAEASGMKWAGGLGFGGGVILDGAELESLGKKGRKITSAFKLALEEIFQGKMISQNTQAVLTTDIPKFISLPMAAFLNHRVKKEARKNGVIDLKRKFYLEKG